MVPPSRTMQLARETKGSVAVDRNGRRGLGLSGRAPGCGLCPNRFLGDAAVGDQIDGPDHAAGIEMMDHVRWPQLPQPCKSATRG